MFIVVVAGCLDPFPATTTETASTGDATLPARRRSPPPPPSPATSRRGTTTSALPITYLATTAGDDDGGADHHHHPPNRGPPAQRDKSTTEIEPGPPSVQRCQRCDPRASTAAQPPSRRRGGVPRIRESPCGSSATAPAPSTTSPRRPPAITIAWWTRIRAFVQHEGRAHRAGRRPSPTSVTDGRSPAGNCCATGRSTMVPGRSGHGDHYPPQAAIDGEGFERPAEERDDIQQFIDAWTAAGDVPVAVCPRRMDPIHAAQHELFPTVASSR